MVIKHRSVSVELKYLRSLMVRSQLAEKEKLYYMQYERGFEGEQKFDGLLKTVLTDDCLILQDLLLEYNNSFFQIDTLVIAPQKIYIFEVKNYEGDYYIEADRWYSVTGNEIKNPVHQINRSETLFRQFIQPLKINLTIQSQIIFINPEFTLFEASRKLPIILPTQLNKFLQSLTHSSTKLTQYHKKLADYLINNHVKNSPFTRLPNYQYDHLKKGVICDKCKSYMSFFNRKKLFCQSCNTTENIEVSVIRSVEEYKLLFPEKRVTVSNIMDWCMIIKKRTIRRILQENYKQVGTNRFCYYI